ncbi:adenine-specific DNA-methyltransferase [Paracoccus pantotrophus]|uniref:site-specific DNA-methyltransferase (adenine-specific) n=1 Tax=Paracoccus pantotrophus TaxID=82367 RepID=A0AAE6NXT0_PARPN|nr:site-specific DNA-methyltransferase [Paracoccus pantotrophus]QFG38454.1 site-specific DNA-methyltransferase [Paracoccus pantotrophus]RKS51021.1 adenine-specific DNA-methyltransferase [Paracoccus pantotrophus]
MSETVQTLRDLILDLVPADGSTIGNRKLIGELRTHLPDLDDAEYHAAKEALVAEGLLAKGRGQGGSVSRADGNAPAPVASTSAKPKPAAMPAGNGSAAYAHADEAVLRPDVGVEAQFSHRKPPKTYRYDSSLAPELAWDENGERPFAEWLLNLVAEAAEKGEATVFAEPQVWQGTHERFTSLSQCAARLRSLTKPFLNWAGKAERQQITVPTLPLFVHERHSTQAILETLKSHKARGQTLDLFGDLDLDIADRLDAYEHKGPWTNRLILGDSLQVMNSLLEYEGMGGQVQMIYFDPPYGVKFGSNFQPFVRKTSVKHGSDDEMIREPEMVKAYRDTWELGLHSYLTYLRDRIVLAKEMLAPSGSIFVQISEENVHHVREILEEVFGSENACPMIAFQKTTGAGSPSGGTELPPVVNDYLLWYAKDRKVMQYAEAYREKVRGGPGATQYDFIDIDGVKRKATEEELVDPPEGSRFFAHDNITSQSGGPTTQFPVEFEGKTFFPSKGGWKTNSEGMENLRKEGRLFVVGDTLRYVRYLDDFPYSIINNFWTDTVISGFGDPKIYVVRTSKKVIERCMLMVTEPGDLVLDITCGSGTTAAVAEQWGRRWITCDTSRVPIALARQRLLTSNFPWYQLKEPKKGPAGGFVYQRKRNKQGVEVGGLVPKITLQSIAKKEDAGSRIISDRPEISRGITRVCGPFTVEATIQASMSMEEDAEGASMQPQSSSPRAYLDRMIEVLRQSKSLSLPGNVTLQLDNVRPLADREHLHAEAVAKNGSEKTIAIAFGPEDGAIGSDYVFNAAMEAMQQGFGQLFLFGFAIQAKAREILEKMKIPTAYISMTPDVVMSDLLKTTKGSEIFSITGLPDVRLEKAGKRDDGTPLYRVVLRGLDIFLPHLMDTDHIDAENLPCWMLDTNHNGMAFYASQVFFPKTSAWDNLQKSLKGQFEDSVWSHLAGTVSEPFALGDKKRIAVKVIDERGNELMATRSEEDAV